MKIVFLSYYTGINSRGVETWVDELSTRLQASGHSVIVYDHHRLSSPNLLPKLPSDTDILIPTNGRIQSLLSRIWCSFHHAKLVIVGHSGLGADDKFNLFCFPDCFVGLTDYQCAWAKKVNPFIKITKISNGVDLNKYSPKINPIKLDLPHPIILYTAALEPIKRHELLIKAMINLKASLLLVGDGSQKDNVQKLCELYLPGRFQIRQFPPSQMPSVYRACDIFVYPTSPWESFGISLLEAMASNLPVVASDDPIRREIVRNAGLFVNPENTVEFTTTIKKAMGTDWHDSPHRQAKKYIWDAVAEDYLKLFKNL